MAVYRTITAEIPAYREAQRRQVAVPRVARLGLLGSLTLKAAAGLVVVFVAALTLSRLVPGNSVNLHSLITPPAGCAMPCWGGIQPGVTTVADAVAILQTNATVADYTQTLGKISWWWNGEQTSGLDASGRAFHGRMETAIVEGQERVTSIVLDTTVRMGDVQLALGEPDSITLHTIQSQDAAQHLGIVYVAHYHNLSVFTMLDCPMTVADFSNAQVYLAFGAPMFAFDGETFQFATLPDWFFRDQAPGCSVG